jgi:uncharacterized protein YjbJ (UPF0337 family)
VIHYAWEALQSPRTVAVTAHCNDSWNPAAAFDVMKLIEQIEESEMDWNQVEGNWKQVKGKIKEKWGKLTDDDINVINGRRDQLEGKLQTRYGYTRDQVRKDVDDWYQSMRW